MQYMNLPVLLIIIFPDRQPVKSQVLIELFPVIIGTICFVSGCLTGWVLNALRRSKKKSTSSRLKKHAVNDNMQAAIHKADAALEHNVSDLECKLKQAKAENAALKRQLAEAEEFAKPGSKVPVLSAESPKQQSMTLYFLQPSTDGCFGETARVKTAADGLYELSVRQDNPSSALVTFINMPENVSLALQNEPTWILVACERSNIPAPHTRSINTDVPGIAVLRNGEWQVKQKAKISYG